ncbi:MAG: hypothetical protein KAJ47_02910 [Candidatus Aenigmarchaeota archaeon]|nr:hypothetical protein [Candidatus Aenigmarchaeota archaeon]
MEHLAILNKSEKDWLKLIVDGRKTIESRWYKCRCAPWDKIKAGESIFFKNSGLPVTVQAKVSKVLQMDNLNLGRVQEIYSKYGRQIGLDEEEIDQAINNKGDKKYCILVFLEKVKEIPPFSINKSGFGLMSAWISTESIAQIKR